VKRGERRFCPGLAAYFLAGEKVRALSASNFSDRMGNHRALAAASLTALAAAGVVITTPASAETTVPYRSAAESTALELSLLGQSISIGISEASVDGTPVAASHAVGALLPVLGLQGEETADLANPGDGLPTCSPLTLPAELAMVSLAVACGNAATADGPSATTSAGVASLSVSATSLLNDTPLSQVPVEQTLDQLLGGLTPVFEVLSGLGLDAESLVSELLAGITQGGDLIAVDLGPSTATAGAADASTLASSLAQGAVIRVIDRALLGLPPVLTIEVGASGASVEAPRSGAQAVPIVDPSLVRITVAPDIATILGLPTAPIEVAPGQEICLPLPAPLESCITVAAGRTLDTADGGKRAESEGVGLRLLTGLPGGGIVLKLAAASAEAAAVAPEVAREQTAPAAPSLPRTGGSASLPLALGLAAAGIAGLATVGASRRRSA